MIFLVMLDWEKGTVSDELQLVLRQVAGLQATSGSNRKFYFEHELAVGTTEDKGAGTVGLLHGRIFEAHISTPEQSKGMKLRFLLPRGSERVQYSPGQIAAKMSVNRKKQGIELTTYDLGSLGELQAGPLQ